MSDTPGLRENQISKAVIALLKHVVKQQAKANELLEDDELLYLVRQASSIEIGTLHMCTYRAHVGSSKHGMLAGRRT